MIIAEGMTLGRFISSYHVACDHKLLFIKMEVYRLPWLNLSISLRTVCWSMFTFFYMNDDQRG